MLKLLISLGVLVVAIFLTLFSNQNEQYLPSHHNHKDRGVFKCPFTSMSKGLNNYFSISWRSLIPKILRNLRVPISWVKYFNLNGFYAESFRSDVTTLQLPNCRAQPFHEKDLLKYKHASFLGQVYDVSTYPEMYGEDSIYAYLTGFEATRAFTLSSSVEDVEEMKNKNLPFALNGLDTYHLNELLTWMNLFRSKYACIGYLPGVFYHEMGEPTDYLLQLISLWSKARIETINLYSHFTRCQVIRKEKSAFYTCSEINGKQYVPRNIMMPIENSPKCVCIRQDEPDHISMRPLYKCPPKYSECQVFPDENDDFEWAKLRVKIPRESKSY